MPGAKPLNPSAPKKAPAIGLATAERRKSIVAGFTKILAPTWTYPDGNTRHIGFLPATVENALQWLECNTANRPVNWTQAQTLYTSFTTIEDGKPAWVFDANVYVMSWEDIVADSQHRIISFILAYGNRQQIERLLYLLDSMPLSGFKVPKHKDTGAAWIDPAQPLPVPIKTWSLTTKGQPENIAFPVILGADPRVSDKADTDQAKRTGADQLARNAETGKLLAAWNLEPKELQEIIRHMYLRVLPPTGKAVKEGAKYGSIRKGGNIHPDRYPVIALNFQGYINEAMDIIHGQPDAKYQFDCLGISHSILVAVFALAIQGGIPKAKLIKFLEQWAPAEKDENGTYWEKPKTGAAAAYARDMNQTDAKPVISSNERSYIISYFVQQDDPNPDIRTAKGISDLLGVYYEQRTANRLPGWDSTGCPDVISTSLAKKIKAEKKKAAKGE
jgi:hypothetical protein